MTSVETYLEKFNRLGTGDFPVLQKEAMEHFSRLGFPTTRNEEWKYTSIAPLLSTDFSWELPGSAITKNEIIARFPFLKEASFIVLDNGRLNSSASQLQALQREVEIKSI